MQKVNGSVVSGNSESYLFTYSEEEREQQEVNSANAKLVFSPKFIPLYPQLLKNGYTITEAIIFGFIDFYVSSASDKFYFTNKQISEMLCTSESSISHSITKLEKNNLIKTHRKIRSGGGQIRFITLTSKNVIAHLANFASLTSKKVQTNNNKIKENKINKNNIYINKQTEVCKVGVNSLINSFKGVNPSYERLYANTTQRDALQRMVDKHGEQKIRDILIMLPKIIIQPYAPRITTPLQLEQKMGELISYIAQRGATKRRGGVYIDQSVNNEVQSNVDSSR